MAVKNPRTKSKLVEKHFIGDEPFYPEIQSRSDPNLTRALNWYSFTADLKDGRQWLYQWMKSQSYPKDVLESIKGSSDAYMNSTVCWLARMANNGTSFSEANLAWMKEKIEEIKNRFDDTKVEKVVDDSEPIDLQKRIRQKNGQTLAMADEMVVDAHLCGNKVSMYEFLKSNEISPQAANFLKERYQKCKDEVFEDHPDIKEAYGKSLKSWQTFWTTLLADIDQYIGNKKAVKIRKPRTVKEKPLAKLVEKMVYQKAYDPLQLVSIPPQEIVGAQQLWTYNTKTRKLSWYNASGPSGLSVKGKSIIGFEEEKSVEKTLRKPENVLKDVLTSGKVAIKKVMGAINSKEYKPSGRVNDQTILLRGVK